MSSTLDRVMQLRPISYQYYRQKDNRHTLGFIAQEAQSLFPELVFTGEDGKLGMSYAHTGVVAIKAVQEQQKILAHQAEEIAFLKAENAAFETRLRMLEEKIK